ncbi:MAG: tetratricopeptide repeat protein [Bacteroidaceae bacterium]|nr:tetratricopeptide repeat protein [Bacteroidaceae bacterium]
MRHLILAILFLLPLSVLCQDAEYARLVRLGIRALDSDSFAVAERLFLKAIDMKPAEASNAVLYLYLGQLRVREGRRDEAMMAFDSGLKLSPSSQELLLDRASLHIQSGNETRALDDLCDLLTLNPDHQEALFFRAYIYAGQHLNVKARADYGHLLELQPRHREARLGLALLCDKDKRPREAMEHIEVLLRYYPDDATVYAVRGGIYQTRRQYEAALADMNHAIALEPDSPDFYISRALLYKDFHKDALAVSDFRHAVELGASPEECAALMGQVP